MSSTITNKKEIAQYGIDNLLEAGAGKAQVLLVETEKSEMQIDAKKLSMFRSTTDYKISLTAMVEGKKGKVSINKIDKESVKAAARKSVETAESSQKDEANDIAEKQEPKEFKTGPDSPDFDAMYERISGFLEHVLAKHPLVVMETCFLVFTKTKSYFKNSNGVDFTSEKGVYSFDLMFTSKEGKKASSFNFTGITMSDLEKELYELGSLKTLLSQSEEQVETKGFPGKVTGDIIITPDCMGSFVHYLTSYLGDGAMIKGTSIYKDKLDTAIADTAFTLHSKPTSDELADNYFVTSDGYEAADSTIVDNGVLKSYLLSLYGANKTGLKRSENSGGCFIVEPGDSEFDRMVQSVKKGILLCRFSGGRPGENGDFSGVAKNSYYIEDGKIQYPLSETMVAGNIAAIFNNIKAISKERVNFGSAIFPWVQFENVTISGK